MLKLFSKNFWDVLARLILRNKIGILIFVVLITLLLSTQWKHMSFTYTEANLLPDEHEVNLTYNNFLDVFGEEGNLVILGIKDNSLYTLKTTQALLL